MARTVLDCEGSGSGHMVGIAQLAERLVVVQEVAGSSPVTHPKAPPEEDHYLRLVADTRTVRSPRR